jgi:hypothetical protein
VNRPDFDVIEARADATVLIARDDVPILITYAQELEGVRADLEDQIIELRRNYDDEEEIWGIADSEIYAALGAILDRLRGSSPSSANQQDGSPNQSADGGEQTR